jgi:PKD repeat protein
MKNFLYFFIFALLVSNANLYAQGGAIKKCDTPHYSEEDFLQDPLLRQSYDELEEFTRIYTENYQTLKLQQTTPYVIPVVFHIIHTYSNNFISDAQVHDALRIINEDFRKQNADISQVHSSFQSIAADSEIEFRLARLDPNGNCTNGITRTNSELTHTAHNNVKSLIMWDQSKYMNVWVVQTISSGAGGYAYYPNNSTISVDGIVIRNAQFGSIGTSSSTGSRSLSHEIGHYLNLRHTWGNSNNPGLASNCSTDDDVLDTPNTIGNTSCNLNATSCTSLDNIQNYMEYTFCERMFTNGQKVRMHAALNAFAANRNNLWIQSNLLATGTNNGYVPIPCIPVADFKSGASFICEGETITFTDYSWRGDIDTYDWSFPGGTPSTSNVANPTVTYNTAGVYPVTLTVSNASGSDSKTLNDIVHVRSALAPNWAPATEDFENISAFPSAAWIVQNDGGNGWELTTDASYNGSTSVRIFNYSGNVSGKTDALITPAYNLTYLSGTTLKFKLAFAVRAPASSDQLRVFATNSCGQFWTQRYSKSGELLSTWGLYGNNFVPTTQNQWREESVNISSGLFSGQPNVSFKFEYTHDTGNNIYIDDINIDGLVSTGGEIETVGMNMYPNPAVTTTRVEFTLVKDNHVTVKLLDVLGREIKTVAEAKLPAGAHYTEITGLETSGVYFVKLIIGQDEVVNKLVVR